MRFLDVSCEVYDKQKNTPALLRGCGWCVLRFRHRGGQRFTIDTTYSGAVIVVGRAHHARLSVCTGDVVANINAVAHALNIDVIGILRDIVVYIIRGGVLDGVTCSGGALDNIERGVIDQRVTRIVIRVHLGNLRVLRGRNGGTHWSGRSIDPEDTANNGKNERENGADNGHVLDLQVFVSPVLFAPCVLLTKLIEPRGEVRCLIGGSLCGTRCSHLHG